MNKQYGYFDDSRREYVITDPQTPYPWINYLGTDDFFSLISNTAGGYCFYRDAKFRRLLRYRYNGVPMDAGGRYFYIREDDAIWSPGWKPCKTPLESYECRHGMGYTRITGVRGGLKAEALFFVPRGHACEIHSLTLSNESDCVKTFKVYSFVEWCLWNAASDMENFQRNLSTGEVEIERGGSVLYHKTEYRERRNHFAFYACNSQVDGYDTDRESFLGLYNGFEAPSRVLEGEFGSSHAHGWSPVASHCISLSLEPGEKRRIDFILGYIENPQEEKFTCDGLLNKTRAHEMMKAFSTPEKIDEALSDLASFWDEMLGGFQLSLDGEKGLERMVNVWNQYQCMVTFNMSRSASFFESGIGRGMGFRDSNQDLAGFVHQVPEKARERILDIASTQFPDGSCYHQYQPLSKRGNNDIGTGFGDDPLWLIFGTVCYVKETGDFGILAEKVPFDNVPGSEKTLFEHLRISLDRVANNLGPHGLPLIGRADWNDCLNLNCFSFDPNESFQTTENKVDGSKAESLMIAGLFIVEARDYAALCRAYAQHCGENSYESEALRAETLAQKMDQSVRDNGWDGEWFLRAYDYYGRPVGTAKAQEGRIFIESQGWCAMARVGASEGLCAKALDSVKTLLDSPYGIVLNNPAFTSYIPDYGEISTYPEGYKENAGVFCHNNPWIIIAETLEGRGEDAWEHYRKICPAYIEDQTLHRMEPYVYSQMIAGKDAARGGEAKNSWLTGTAAWNWHAVTKYILGIRPDFDCLVIDPCIPSSWKEYKVIRRWRDAEYKITVHNPRGLNRSDKPLRVPYSPGCHEIELEL